MPEVKGQWQDWTAEEYAQTDEWQRHLDQMWAEQEEQLRGLGLPRSVLETAKRAYEDARTRGPRAADLNRINTQGMAQFQTESEAATAFDELGDTPEAAMPSLAEIRRYGLGEMDLQSRAASLQAGAASQRLGGLNPSARAMGLSEISRGGSGMVGQGVGQSAAMAGQANLASYQGAMQNRGMMGNAIQQSLNQGYAMQQIGLQHQNAMELARYQYAQQRKQQQRGGGFWGAMGSIAGTALGGPFGGMAGGWLGRKLFSGGGGGQQQQSPYGGQTPYSQRWGGGT